MNLLFSSSGRLPVPHFLGLTSVMSTCSIGVLFPAAESFRRHVTNVSSLGEVTKLRVDRELRVELCNSRCCSDARHICNLDSQAPDCHAGGRANQLLCYSAVETQQVAESRDRDGRAFSRRFLIALPLVAATLREAPASASVFLAESPPAPYSNMILRTLGIGDPDIYYPPMWRTVPQNQMFPTGCAEAVPQVTDSSPQSARKLSSQESLLPEAVLQIARIANGTWNCYSTLIEVTTPQGEDKADQKSVDFSRKQLGYTVPYQVRFTALEGKVICDRLFTTTSLVEATVGKNVIEEGQWTPEKPNRLVLVLKGGTKVENLVTKRSAEYFQEDQYDTSEFSKQVFDYSAIRDGPPTVKASQNLTRYHWDSAASKVNKMEAIQKVSMYAVPMEGMDMFNTRTPVAVYKYRIEFER